METCRTSFTVHRTSSETALDGGFKGMASVFHTLIDAYIPTRIQPGAFTKTLRENQKRIKEARRDAARPWAHHRARSA